MAFKQKSCMVRYYFFPIIEYINLWPIHAIFFRILVWVFIFSICMVFNFNCNRFIAYFHILNQPDYHRFLCFIEQNNIYPFMVPFGTSSAPPNFSRVIELSDSHKLQIILYLDAWVAPRQCPSSGKYMVTS